MAKKPSGTFRFTKVEGQKVIYSVTFVSADEHVSSIGTVEHRWYSHIKRMGWEATGNDGHRAVHDHRWQAAKALIVDLTHYPFPIRLAA